MVSGICDPRQCRNLSNTIVGYVVALVVVSLEISDVSVPDSNNGGAELPHHRKPCKSLAAHNPSALLNPTRPKETTTIVRKPAPRYLVKTSTISRRPEHAAHPKYIVSGLAFFGNRYSSSSICKSPSRLPLASRRNLAMALS